MPDTERKPLVCPGETLPNGAIVLAYKETKSTGSRYVLAVWKRDEYVVWAIDGEKHTDWGHYFMDGDIVAAAKDFAERGE